MVGDAEVLQAEFHCLVGHRLERVQAIGSGGVVVEGAAELGKFDKAGQAVIGGGFDLAAVLADFRRDEIEAKGAVDVGFVVDFGKIGLAVGNRCHGSEAVFVEG